jgi:hemolysin III
MKKTSLGELIANAVSHGIGAILSIAGLVILLVIADTTSEIVAGIIYGTSLIILYFSSTLLHSFPEKMTRVFTVFQRLDHSSIFLLISGTYTPFLLVLVKTKEAYILFGILWGLTILGIVLKSIWISKFQMVHLAIYLIMGWSIMFIYKQALPLLGDAMIYVVIGGLCYTLGVAFYVSRFKYQHFVWHLFVLAGSLIHFVSILMIY